MYILFIYLFTSCGPKVVKDYYQSGELKVKREVKGEKEHGRTVWYYENGNIEEDLNYVDGELHGLQKYYYEDGTLKRETYYFNDIENGEFKDYYPNGKLYAKVNVIKGKREGVAEIFYKSGKLKQSYSIHSDSLDGDFSSYYENGKLHVHAVYDMGKAIYVKKYDEKGKLVKSERRIIIVPENDSIFLGQVYKAKIAIAAPQKGEKYLIKCGIPKVSGSNIKFTEFDTLSHQSIANFEFHPSNIGQYTFPVFVDVATTDSTYHYVETQDFSVLGNKKES